MPGGIRTPVPVGEPLKIPEIPNAFARLRGFSRVKLSAATRNRAAARPLRSRAAGLSSAISRLSAAAFPKA